MLLGVEPPSSGVIEPGGQPLKSLSRIEIARRVQPIFQDPYSSLNPRKCIGDIVALPLIVHDVGTERDRRRRVGEIIELVGLSQRHLSVFPSQLSGGQRQRVAIARALIMRPQIVIATNQLQRWTSRCSPRS